LRGRYALWMGLTILVGLASRKFMVLGPAPGDVLYATLLYWGMRFLAPTRPRRHAMAAALALSVGVELSQLLHSPWLDALRATRVGGWVLGHGFLWGDLVCYGVGVGLGAALDRPGPTRQLSRSEAARLPLI
jgi:hypothetical protein